MRRHRMVHGDRDNGFPGPSQKGTDAHRPYLPFHVSHLRGRLPDAPAFSPSVRLSLGRARVCLYAVHLCRGIRKRPFPAKAPS